MSSLPEHRKGSGKPTAARPAANRDPRTWQVVFGSAMMVPPAVRLAMYSRVLDNDDVLSRLRLPTLVIHGRADHIVRVSAAEQIARTVPGASPRTAAGGNGRMTLTDKTIRSQTESISFEFELRYSPEKVWHALTDPAALTEWLLPVVDLKLEPDAAFKFKAEPQPGWDGVVDCQFVEIEPQRKVSYTWVVGQPGSEFFLDTVVTFTLTPTASGTHLSLVHSGFKQDQKRAFGGARYGWKMMGGKLIDLLARIP